MRRLLQQGIRFIGVSGIGWLIDFGLFNLLHLFIGPVSVCNIISSLAGVSFVFCVSTRNIFINAENGAPLKLKFIIYVVYQLILIFLISQLLSWTNGKLQGLLAETFPASYTAMIAKILVTPITMILNFFVMKVLVEKVTLKPGGSHEE